jgi:hypothetical protein
LAYIEKDVKERMERYALAHGLKEGFLIQSALDHYSSALEDLFGSEIVPVRISVDHESWGTSSPRRKKNRSSV